MPCRNHLFLKARRFLKRGRRLVHWVKYSTKKNSQANCLLSLACNLLRTFMHACMHECELPYLRLSILSQQILSVCHGVAIVSLGEGVAQCEVSFRFEFLSCFKALSKQLFKACNEGPGRALKKIEAKNSCDTVSLSLLIFVI